MYSSRDHFGRSPLIVMVNQTQMAGTGINHLEFVGGHAGK